MDLPHSPRYPFGCGLTCTTFAYRDLTVKELAGFGRVHLVPGESKRVELLLHHDQTAFIDADGAWKIEKGKFRVLVGASSEDIRLEGSFEIKEDRHIKGRKRHFYALAQSE